MKIIGQYVGDTDSRFTLVRYAIRCCTADAVQVDAVIMPDPNAPSKEKLDPESGKWVEVTGRVEFVVAPARPTSTSPAPPHRADGGSAARRPREGSAPGRLLPQLKTACKRAGNPAPTAGFSWRGFPPPTE